MAMLVEGAGRLVPIRDADALAAAMKHIVTDRPNVVAMRERARQFTVEATIKQWLDLFDDARAGTA
jgi:glycosyltransferase involved in cell wall biosynthesis